MKWSAPRVSIVVVIVEKKNAGEIFFLNMYKHFTNEDIQKANNDMKRCSALITTRKCKLKPQ